jgi:hypothetical protein
LDILGSAKLDTQQLGTLGQVSASSLRICVHSALHVIRIMHRVLSPPDPLRHLLGAWWFSLYYSKSEAVCYVPAIKVIAAFNAALVIYSALLIEHQTKLQDQPIVFETNDLRVDHLQQAIECISLLFKGNRMTEKCVQYISHLAQLLSVICKYHHMQKIQQY